MRGSIALLGLALAGSAFSGAIAAPGQGAPVVGVTDGGLAAASLATRDYRQAAARLKEKSPDAINDPARLINLGNAYAGMGRYDKAKAAYISARYAPDTMLLLADGSEASSRDVAYKAMTRLGTSFAAR